MQKIEDEWEREIDSENDLDLLFVTYDSSKITVDQLTEEIKQLKFVATVKNKEE